MKEITLHGNKGVALVDDEWYPILSRIRWHLSKKGYAQRCPKPGRTIMMHQVIAMTPAGLTTDHVNGNKLDNRATNLRICTNAENCRAKGKHRDNTSGFKGVSKRPDTGKWQASIMVDQKAIYLGVYEDPRDAARAYDAAAITHHGEFAVLNFPRVAA